MYLPCLYALMILWTAPELAVAITDAVSRYQAVRQPQICFATDLAESQQDEIVQCTFSHPGFYPPASATLKKGRCCFEGTPDSGVFWAMGQSVMSQVMAVDPDASSLTPIEGAHPDSRQMRFTLRDAVLVDIKVVDGMTDEPIVNARVTMADDAMHLVSFARWTDTDGYAVLPMIPGESYVVTVRADNYLAAVPFAVSPEIPVQQAETGSDEDLPVIERVVELDPGICVTGQVLGPDEKGLPGAEVHAEIERSDGLVYVSDIDHPVPMSALATRDTIWIRKYSNNATNARGAYELCTLPRGKMRLYASHPDFPPSRWYAIDASDIDAPTPVEIQMTAGRQAWLRIEDAGGRALSVDVAVYDVETGHLVTTVNTPASGAIQISNLPEKTRFVAALDVPVELIRDIHDNDEIHWTLTGVTAHNYTFYVSNAERANLANVTISIADAAVQKQYAQCVGKSDDSGKISLEMCPEAFWAHIYQNDYAERYIYISSDKTEYNVTLDNGKNIEIVLLDKSIDAAIDCTIETIYTSGDKQYKISKPVQTSEDRLLLAHQPSLGQILRCTDNNVSAQINILPEDTKAELRMPRQITRSIIVVDNYGAPVPYARIVADDEYECDENGRLQMRSKPDQKLNVYHYMHGYTHAVFKDENGELVIRLPDSIDSGLTACLQKHQIKYIEDSAAIQIDISIEKMQIVRGDYIESCSDTELVAVRDGRRFHAKWK